MVTIAVALSGTRETHIPGSGVPRLFQPQFVCTDPHLSGRLLSNFLQGVDCTLSGPQKMRMLDHAKVCPFCDGVLTRKFGKKFSWDN